MTTNENSNRLCGTCKRIYPAPSVFCVRDGTRLTEDVRILAGRFILLRMIGKGGMGSVWEAEQPALERRVALKILHPELAETPHLVQRFNREARAIGKLNHPNILTIYECCQSDGYNFLVMPCLEGESLSQALRREPRMPVRRAVELWLTIAHAMAAAHRQGVLHRDLKPANIFLSKPIVDGAEPHVTVLDFGIAKLLGPRSTGWRTDPGLHMGTPCYMAPEQFTNAESANERADVYALGIMLYELLAGQRAFSKTVKVASDRVAVSLESVAPQVPIAVVRVVAEMMAEDPAKRPTVALACAVLETYGRRLRLATTTAVPLLLPPAAPESATAPTELAAAMAPLASKAEPFTLSGVAPPVPRPARLALVVLPFLVAVTSGVVLQRTLQGRPVPTRSFRPAQSLPPMPALPLVSAPPKAQAAEAAAPREEAPRDRIATAVREILAAGAQDQAARRYAEAARLLGQAEVLARGRERRALRAEIHVARGQLFEAQGQTLAALAEYGQLLRVRANQRSAGEAEMVAQLSARFGRVVWRTDRAGRCQIRQEWRKPGETTVDLEGGLRETVTLRAGETHAAGECRPDAASGRGADEAPVGPSTALVATRLP